MSPPESRRRRSLFRPLAVFRLAALAAAAAGLVGCAKPLTHHLMDALMAGAHRPALPAREPPRSADAGEPASRYTLLAGDLHCHVTPPDRPPHVSRTLAETVALARAEKLDFVVLTPHVRAQFFLSEEARARTLAGLEALGRNVARQARGGPLFIVGFEYTDFAYGHVGASFADLRAVLEAVPVDEAWEKPGRFFEEYVRRGGVLVLNHPLLTPLSEVLPWASYDMSWSPFTAPGPYPAEVAAADRLAQGIEVFNLPIAELRDRFLLFDRHASMRTVLARADREILARQRRLVPVGGSDSHSAHLRATTFVLSEGRTPAAIREGLLAGRTCVRDPAACSLEVRAASGPWLPVGSSLKNVEMVHARARGEGIRVVVNGNEHAPPGPGVPVTVPLEAGRCSVIRAVVGEGYSAPVYANCPF
jgi:hypothetical protein